MAFLLQFTFHFLFSRFKPNSIDSSEALKTDSRISSDYERLRNAGMVTNRNEAVLANSRLIGIINLFTVHAKLMAYIIWRCFARSYRIYAFEIWIRLRSNGNAKFNTIHSAEMNSVQRTEDRFQSDIENALREASPRFHLHVAKQLLMRPRVSNRIISNYMNEIERPS